MNDTCRTERTDRVAAMFDGRTADERAKVLFIAGRIKAYDSENEGYVASQILRAEYCAAAVERHEIMKALESEAVKIGVESAERFAVSIVLREIAKRCRDEVCHICYPSPKMRGPGNDRAETYPVCRGPAEA